MPTQCLLHNGIYVRHGAIIGELGKTEAAHCINFLLRFHLHLRIQDHSKEERPQSRDSLKARALRTILRIRLDLLTVSAPPGGGKFVVSTGNHWRNKSSHIPVYIEPTAFRMMSSMYSWFLASLYKGDSRSLVIAHSRASPCAYFRVSFEDQANRLTELTMRAFTTLNGLCSIVITDAFHNRASFWKRAPGTHSGMYFTEDVLANAVSWWTSTYKSGEHRQDRILR